MPPRLKSALKPGLANSNSILFHPRNQSDVSIRHCLISKTHFHTLERTREDDDETRKKEGENWWKSGRLGDPVAGGRRGGMKRRVGERARKDGDGQCRLVYQSCIVEESLPFSTLLLCWLHPTAPTARSFLSPAPFLLSPPSFPSSFPSSPGRAPPRRRGGPLLECVSSISFRGYLF